MQALTLPECEQLLKTACSIDLVGEAGNPHLTPEQVKQLDVEAHAAIVAVLRAIRAVADEAAKKAGASGEDPR